MTRPVDPLGKRALFEAPVDAAPDAIAGGAPQGKESLYSVGRARPGTVVVECSGCEARSRVSLLDVGLRLLQGSIWMPWRTHTRLMRCPSCGTRQWCRVRWQG